MYSVWSSNFAFDFFAVHQWDSGIVSIVAIVLHKTTLNFRSIRKSYLQVIYIHILSITGNDLSHIDLNALTLFPF